MRLPVQIVESCAGQPGADHAGHGRGLPVPEDAVAADEARDHAGLAWCVSPMEAEACQEEVPGLHEEARQRAVGQLGDTDDLDFSRPMNRAIRALGRDQLVAAGGDGRRDMERIESG